MTTTAHRPARTIVDGSGTEVIVIENGDRLLWGNAIFTRRAATMGAKSAIEWTDATWNPVTGCDKISPGCSHCYAETFAERFRGVPGHPYEQGFDLRFWPSRL